LALPARLFNSSPIQPRRCRILLTKIALLLYTGEKFPTNEATTLFFGISKLFQNKDASLRQMVHLVIKELANSAEDIIMVTSTIMKDTGGSTDIYRPNAIRALCRIMDVRWIPDSIWKTPPPFTASIDIYICDLGEHRAEY
jgi:coatomer subunit gamma